MAVFFILTVNIPSIGTFRNMKDIMSFRKNVKNVMDVERCFNIKLTLQQHNAFISQGDTNMYCLRLVLTVSNLFKVSLAFCEKM